MLAVFHTHIHNVVKYFSVWLFIQNTLIQRAAKSNTHTTKLSHSGSHVSNVALWLSSHNVPGASVELQSRQPHSDELITNTRNTFNEECSFWAEMIVGCCCSKVHIGGVWVVCFVWCLLISHSFRPLVPFSCACCAAWRTKQWSGRRSPPLPRRPCPSCSAWRWCWTAGRQETRRLIHTHTQQKHLWTLHVKYTSQTNWTIPIVIFRLQRWPSGACRIARWNKKWSNWPLLVNITLNGHFSGSLTSTPTYTHSWHQYCLFCINWSDIMLLFWVYIKKNLKM